MFRCLGFWCLGFRVQVFRCSGVWGLGFRCLGVQVFRVSGLGSRLFFWIFWCPMLTPGTGLHSKSWCELSVTLHPLPKHAQGPEPNKLKPGCARSPHLRVRANEAEHSLQNVTLHRSRSPATSCRKSRACAPRTQTQLRRPPTRFRTPSPPRSHCTCRPR